jgi:hypothetical protein
VKTICPYATALQALLVGREEEMTLIFDLAIHTVRQGRSRTIDRYAKAAPPVPGSDEADP